MKKQITSISGQQQPKPEALISMKTTLPKRYINYTPLPPKVFNFRKIGHIVSGLLLWPIYWGLSYIISTPGLRFRKYFIVVGIRFIIKKFDLRNAFHFIVTPLDSLRYFEFEFMWKSVKSLKLRSYLDVSSPRQFPLMVADRSRHVVADFLNPDKRDLEETVLMADTLGIKERCRFHAELIGDALLVPNSYDLVTSMSVVEHIFDDNEAIQKMWDLLKPGGLLLITVPCAAEAYEEYMNRDDYELNSPNSDGFVFFQRFYDEKLLEERIFSVTGKPIRRQIYAEKQAGSYQKNETEKRTNRLYPYWRAPFTLGLHYEYREGASNLPGIGVIGLEFLKR